MEIRLLTDGERGEGLELAWEVFLRYDAAAVSYTHLTLPTS